MVARGCLEWLFACKFNAINLVSSEVHSQFELSLAQFIPSLFQIQPTSHIIDTLYTLFSHLPYILDIPYFPFMSTCDHTKSYGT